MRVPLFTDTFKKKITLALLYIFLTISHLYSHITVLEISDKDIVLVLGLYQFSLLEYLNQDIFAFLALNNRYWFRNKVNCLPSEMTPTNLYYMGLPETQRFNREFGRIWRNVANLTQTQLNTINQGGYYAMDIMA